MTVHTEVMARCRKAARLAGAAEQLVARVEADAKPGEIAGLAVGWARSASAETWAQLAQVVGVRTPSAETQEVVIEMLSAKAEVTL